MGKRLAIYVLAGAVSFWAVYSLYRIITTFAPDFSVYYESGRSLMQTNQVYGISNLYTGLGYPPNILLLFLPFALLPYGIAQAIWILVSFALFLACIVLTLRLVFGRVHIQTVAFVFSLSFLSFPTKFTLGMGQINFLALWLLLVGISLINSTKQTAAGFVIGLLYIVKPHLLLFLPVLFLVRQWKAGWIAAGTFTASVVMFGVLFGWEHFAIYAREVVPQLLVYQGREIYYNQGIGAGFARIFPLEFATVATGVFSIGLLGYGYWLLWWRRLSVFAATVLFLPIFLLVEPLSWQHHYVFLLPVFVYLARVIRGQWELGILAVSYVLISINFPLPAAIPVIIRSHVLAGNLMLFGLVLRRTYKVL